MAIRLSLENVKFGVADLPQRDGVPLGKVVHFFDEQSGIAVEIPLATEAVGQLVGMLTGTKLAMPNGPIPDEALRRGPGAQGSPSRPK